MDKYLFVYYLVTQWDWKILHIIAPSKQQAETILKAHNIHTLYSNMYPDPVYKIRVSCKEKSGLVHQIEIDYEG